MKTKAFTLIVGFLFLVTLNVAAQTETEFAPIKSKVLRSKVLNKSFIKLLQTNDEVRTLAEHLNSKGFVAQHNPKNLYGVLEKYKDGISKRQVRFKFQFQDYSKPDSKDLIALCTFSVCTGNIFTACSKREAETYSFYLIAPNGDYEQMQEYTIDSNLNVIKANSWWSCTKRRVSKKCPGDCLSAFITCIPSGITSIAGYLGCVVSKCAGCLIKAGACCACDCKWYCKWATGCCDR